MNPSSASLIKTVFIHADTAEVIAQAEIPFDQLPDQFEVNSAVQIEQEHWEIISTKPKTKAQASLEGELTLKVRRYSPEFASPQELFYSLPTLCDSTPVVVPGTSKANQSVLELHEDEFRQIELISKGNRARIEEEFNHIEQIYEQHQEAPGVFTQVHIRKTLPDPLKSSISENELMALKFPKTISFKGVAYEHSNELLAQTFAFQNPSGLCFYGVSANDRVSILGLLPTSLKEEHLDSESQQLVTFLEKHSLLLVDFCEMLVLDSDPIAIRNYLSQLS